MPESRKPARPRRAKPPAALAKLVEQLTAQDYSVGLTTTEQGEWAVLVRVPAGTATPVGEISALVGTFPVVYEEVSQMPVARPADPNDASD